MTSEREEPLLVRTRLRRLGIIVPLAGLLVLYPVRLLLLQFWPGGLVDTLTGLLAAAGILIFSRAIFRTIEQQDRVLMDQYAELERSLETERQLRGQLETLHQTALAIASDHTPPTVLQRLVDLARETARARYGALTIFGAHHVVEHMYTSGLSAEDRARLEALPQGHGLLQLVHQHPGPLRVRDVAHNPYTAGVPAHHPPITNLISVPVAHAGHVLGHLYLANRIEGEEFTAEDEHLLTMLGGHAAAVIEFSRLTQQMRTLAVEAERERIRKDLHDSAIQAVYGVNLELEAAAEDVDDAPEEAKQRINLAIDRLSEVMKDIRSIILGLRSSTDAADSLPEALAALLAETRAHTLLETDLHVQGNAAEALPPAIRQNLLQIAREVVANTVRHARAGRLWATLQTTADAVHLRIVDNGSGFSPEQAAQEGHGLAALQRRARDLGGTLTIQSSPGTGTAIDVRIPLPSREQERADV